MFSQNQSEVKLEWMYKGPQSSVDREEYLLGKTIDKGLEQLNAQEKQQQHGVQQPKNHVEHECIPPSIRDYKEQIGEQVDINAKLQEDPLLSIKKQEEEKRRQFLNNPIQIKKLQKALKMQKTMKKKKRKKSKSDSEEELDKKLAKKLKLLKSSDIIKDKSKGNMLDTILMHKYNQLKNQLSQDDLTDILQGKKDKSSSESSSDEESNTSEDNTKNKKKLEKDKGKYKNYRQDKQKNRKVSSSSEEERKPSKKSYNRQERYSKKKVRRESSDSDDYRGRKERSKKYSEQRTSKHEQDSTNKNKLQQRKYEYTSESDTVEVQKKNWGLVRADGTKIPLSKQSSTKVTQQKVDTQKDNKVLNYKKREKLTEEEKEKRRQEMMRNASWRDKERASNLKVYREGRSKEETQKEYNPDFLKRELLKSANNSSVESRIKANINNIQRSGNDMTRHFSKR